VKTWAVATAEPKTHHNLIDFYQIKTIKTTTYKTIYISLGHGDHWSSFMGDAPHPAATKKNISKEHPLPGQPRLALGG